MTDSLKSMNDDIRNHYLSKKLETTSNSGHKRGTTSILRGNPGFPQKLGLPETMIKDLQLIASAKNMLDQDL